MKHNRLDYACINWIGDMNPKKGDLINTELGGDFTRFDKRRCVVCNPYTEDEANELLDANLFSLV